GRILIECDHAQGEAAVRGELDGLGVRELRVRPDAEPEVEPGRVVAQLGEHVPEREAVLPARDRNQEALRGREHALAGDRALDLAAEVEEVARPAEGRVVGAELDLGLRPAARALHVAPPEMTARISTSSASSTTSASVSRRSPRITMAVPGRMPRSWSSCATRRRPAIS